MKVNDKHPLSYWNNYYSYHN